MYPAGTNGNKDSLLAGQIDGFDVRGGDELPAVQKGPVQIADDEPDFLPCLSYFFFFQNRTCLYFVSKSYMKISRFSFF
jgi:hypothetical protein